MSRGPEERTVRWAARALGAGAKIKHIEGLRFGSNPWLLHLDRGGEPSTVVLRVGGAGIGTEAAALRVANQHGIPAPTLLGADVGGDDAGTPAVLSTALPGTSQIPIEVTAERLRTMGAIAATISGVRLEPVTGLPLRNRPVSAEDFEADRRRTDSPSNLMSAAVAKVAGMPTPDGRVLVHGDFWQGNMLWVDDLTVALIDWDMAGVGDPGLDLGSARLDAALMFGQDAAGPVLDGWEDTANAPAENVAYWDAVAALSTPADMDLWRPTIHAQGRDDLPASTLTARRDAFLAAALERF